MEDIKDDGWTTGDDGNLKHNRVIDIGAYRELHELQNIKSREVCDPIIIVDHY